MSAEPCYAPGPPVGPSEQARHPGLLEKTREILRLKHYSYRTEQSYLGGSVRQDGVNSRSVFSGLVVCGHAGKADGGGSEAPPISAMVSSVM